MRMVLVPQARCDTGGAEKDLVALLVHCRDCEQRSEELKGSNAEDVGRECGEG